MNRYTFEHNGVTYERVTKAKARSMFMHGKKIYVQACNLRPWTLWSYPMCITKTAAQEIALDEIGIRNWFDNAVNSFEFYNCINSETGKYAAFYMEDEKQ